MLFKDIISYLEGMLQNSKVDAANLLLKIEKKFPPQEVYTCYKYILENKTDNYLLNLTLRRINKIKYESFLPLLIDFIIKPDNNSDLKVLAIKTISVYKDKTALGSLMYCLNDKNSNYKIRLAAAEALGKIGDKNAFEALGNVLADKEEKSAYVKESAAAALGMLGDERAIDVFKSIMFDRQMFNEKFTFLKEKIVEAISKFDIKKDKKALDILKNSLLEPQSSVRISSIETLMNSGSNEAYDLIYERLIYDDDIEVKKNALVALYNLSDRRILDEVIKGEFDKVLKDCAYDIIKEYEDE